VRFIYLCIIVKFNKVLTKPIVAHRDNTSVAVFSDFFVTLPPFHSQDIVVAPHSW